MNTNKQLDEWSSESHRAGRDWNVPGEESDRPAARRRGSKNYFAIVVLLASFGVLGVLALHLLGYDF